MSELKFGASAMKTVLKDTKTGLLFRHMDEWTSSLEEAAGFRDTLTALRFCRRNNLSGVAVMQAYSDGTPNRVTGFRRVSIPQTQHERKVGEVSTGGTAAL